MSLKETSRADTPHATVVWDAAMERAGTADGLSSPLIGCSTRLCVEAGTHSGREDRSPRKPTKPYICRSCGKAAKAVRCADCITADWNVTK